MACWCCALRIVVTQTRSLDDAGAIEFVPIEDDLCTESVRLAYH
jgi:hypothetical protein